MLAAQIQRDEKGQQVDDGDYVAVGPHTLAFPSHATEFGYTGEIDVDYAISDDVGRSTCPCPGV
ncbi:MAG: hypothetical protein ABI783_05130 [Actinomycetota bacterium]